MKFAFVVQRYGCEVLGGVETQARWIAERLVARGNNITVLTTTALDHQTWKNELLPGDSQLNGVPIKRFHVRSGRSWFFRYYHRLVKNILRNHKRLPLPRWVISGLDRLWFYLQGPHSPELLAAIQDYDRVFFFTYLYEPSVCGLLQVSERSVLIPAAHEEDSLYFPGVERLFGAAQDIFVNTETEMSLIFNTQYEPKRLWMVGNGVDIPKVGNPPFQRANGYLVYMGRLDKKKGVGDLLEKYGRYRTSVKRPLDLVIIGSGRYPQIEMEGVSWLGFVSVEEKVQILKAATALINLSQHESLSIVVLESLACGVPVILNANCPVFQEYRRKAPGVFLVENQSDFEASVEKICRLGNENASHKLQNWVTENYGWDRILRLYENFLHSSRQSCSS